jgi:hypothetical protein
LSTVVEVVTNTTIFGIPRLSQNRLARIEPVITSYNFYNSFGILENVKSAANCGQSAGHIAARFKVFSAFLDTPSGPSIA